MNKINILKKLGLIKYNWFNAMSGETYYSPNKNSILFWIILVLLWILLFIPYVVYGIFIGIKLVITNLHKEIIYLFELTEKGKIYDRNNK